VAIGDPLYRPFGRSLGSYGEQLHLENSPLAAWADTRKLNSDAVQGRAVDALIQLALTSPTLPTNAVSQETLARLYYRAGRFRSGIEWLAKAVRQECTPMERTRDLLELAEWQSEYSQPKDAMNTLEQLIKARPDYPAMLDLRAKQLKYAKDAGAHEETKRIQAEIDRLPAGAAAGKNP
jgi:tetratricopeptide (TPR) repeat protein